MNGSIVTKNSPREADSLSLEEVEEVSWKYFCLTFSFSSMSNGPLRSGVFSSIMCPTTRLSRCKKCEECQQAIFVRSQIQLSACWWCAKKYMQKILVNSQPLSVKLFTSPAVRAELISSLLLPVIYLACCLSFLVISCWIL